jgi:alanine racemase
VKSWVEVSEQRLKANVAAVQATAGSEADVLAVVKAKGYGHNAELVAPVLAAAGARWLGVDDAEQGARVRQALGRDFQTALRTRLLVMCGIESEDAMMIVAERLTPVVWTATHLQALEAAAAAVGGRLTVHLEIDSGMARQGAAPGAELTEFLAALTKMQHVELEGVMSHLSSAEIAGSSVTEQQRERFSQALAQVTAAGVRPRLLHLANSSALDEESTTEWMRETAATMDARVLVRPGLAVYGHCLPLELAESPSSLRRGVLATRLQPVLSWKTRVIGTRSIAAGQTVGYGATFVAERPMRLALLPVGYADGFRREASSGIGDGWVRIGSARAPVVGRVSMNLTIVDVSAIEGVREGDEVVLLGEGVSAGDHARWCGTIPYEVLCGIRAHARLA